MHNPLKPTRQDGLQRLARFAPQMGRQYAATRNEDRGPGAHTNVSCLSPYHRHRLVLERESVAEAVAAHGARGADKFISEVYWRTYFKGHLERKPSIWTAYARDVSALWEDKSGALANDLEAAEGGQTGIDAYDHWVRELVDTGYLHNHARMWFASIWIFTLRLPWQLGADFMLRHLLDGDPASNTLSWRWVGGLHTKGKTYLARPDNIARFTKGRFHPKGLAATAPPLTEEARHHLLPPPQGDQPPQGPVLWLVTPEDCAGEDLAAGADVAGVALSAFDTRSTLGESDAVLAFARGAVDDAGERLGGAAARVPLQAGPLADAARAAGASAIATPYAPVGPTADALAAARDGLAEEGIPLHTLLRLEDRAAWPYANAGFFKLKKAIPSLLPS
ncbi:MAG: FAD-binding domain-containing protein [Pseudomonadota bacterium]